MNEWLIQVMGQWAVAYEFDGGGSKSVHAVLELDSCTARACCLWCLWQSEKAPGRFFKKLMYVCRICTVHVAHPAVCLQLLLHNAHQRDVDGRWPDEKGPEVCLSPVCLSRLFSTSSHPLGR